MKNVIMFGFLAIFLAGFLSACPSINLATVQLTSGLTAQVLDEKGWGINLKASEKDAHLLFYNEDRMELTYARITDDHWAFKRSWDFGEYNYGASHDLALDDRGKVHVSSSLSDGSDEDLGYVNNVIGFWVTTQPDAPGGSSVGMGSKIAIDHRGKAHILHHRWNDGALLYTTNAGILWQTTKLLDDTSPDGIVVDSQNNVHVFTGGQHLIKVDGQWQTEELPIGCFGNSFAIDEDDNLYILSGSRLWLKPAGGDWQEQDIFAQMFEPSSYFDTYYNSLAVDDQGYLHLAFSTTDYIVETEKYDYHVYYGSNQSGRWQAVEIDHQLDVSYAYYWDTLAVAALTSDKVCFVYKVNDQIRYIAFDPAQFW